MSAVIWYPRHASGNFEHPTFFVRWSWQLRRRLSFREAIACLNCLCFAPGTHYRSVRMVRLPVMLSIRQVALFLLAFLQFHF